MPTLDEVKPKLDAEIASIRDFPKKGINFRDIMPVFANAQLVKECCEAIAEHVRTLGKVDYIAGLEARGFLFGPIVAMFLNLPFVPIRKQGKLPGECVQASYLKEYGEDVIEIQKGAIREGANVLLIDDLLATGGTLAGAVDLVKKVGANVTEAFVLIELVPLKGREKLPGVNLHTLLAYNEA